MVTVNLQEAGGRLGELIARVASGEIVVVVAEDGSEYEISPLSEEEDGGSFEMSQEEYEALPERSKQLIKDIVETLRPHHEPSELQWATEFKGIDYFLKKAG